MEAIPHPAVPFSIGRDGTQVVDQDSEADVAGCVYNICVCPQGFRVDLPEFGRPSMVDGYYPVDLERLEQAISQWEPEVDLSLEQQREAVGAAGITITVE